jgi:hypothetical protein
MGQPCGLQGPSPWRRAMNPSSSPRLRRMIARFLATATARAGDRLQRVSAPRAHMKAPYKTDLHRKNATECHRRVNKRPGRARADGVARAQDHDRLELRRAARARAAEVLRVDLLWGSIRRVAALRKKRHCSSSQIWYRVDERQYKAIVRRSPASTSRCRMLWS